jgi:hypothetical protein
MDLLVRLGCYEGIVLFTIGAVLFPSRKSLLLTVQNPALHIEPRKIMTTENRKENQYRLEKTGYARLSYILNDAMWSPNRRFADTLQ